MVTGFYVKFDWAIHIFVLLEESSGKIWTKPLNSLGLNACNK